MDLEFLKILAQKCPALARAIEISIYSFSIYVIGAIIGDSVFSYQAMLVSLFTPVLAYLSKYKRDLGK